MSENIREYNFSIPGNTSRHIPGIPGEWPAGSIVQVDMDTNTVLGVVGLPASMIPELQKLEPTLRPVSSGEEQPAIPPAQQEVSSVEELRHIEQELAQVEQEQQQ